MEEQTSELNKNIEEQPAKTEPAQTEGWFEQAMADFDYALPKRGQILDGTILRVEEDAIIVDVGLKRDAIVTARDLSQVDKSYLEHLSVGDQVIVSVLQQPVGDQDLMVSLSQGLAYQNWGKAEQLLEEGTILDLEVVGQNKGGILVDFEGLRGFIPASHLLELRRMRSQPRIQQYKRDLIGTHLPVKAIEVDRRRRRLVFSSLAAQEEQRKHRLETLEEGQIFLQATVVSVVNFGIFVDLDGIDGLVHISELDWQKVDHPSDHFKPGDKVDVKVIGVNVEKERISLSRKALQPSPWASFAENHKPGDVITGTVTKVVDFGAFVELEEGIVGLVHISEIGYSAPGSPKEVVKNGDTILVRILDLNPEKERISLSMRRVPLERQISWLAETMDIEAIQEELAGQETTEQLIPGDETEQQVEAQEAKSESPEIIEDAKQSETDTVAIVAVENTAQPDEHLETSAESEETGTLGAQLDEAPVPTNEAEVPAQLDVDTAELPTPSEADGEKISNTSPTSEGAITAEKQANETPVAVSEAVVPAQLDIEDAETTEPSEPEGKELNDASQAPADTITSEKQADKTTVAAEDIAATAQLDVEDTELQTPSQTDSEEINEASQ